MIDLTRDIDLKKYLPAVSRDSLDMQALSDTQSVEFNELWNVLCKLFADAYIKHMDEFATSQWESTLDISKLDSQSIEERKNEILKILRGQRPYTLRAFRRILRNIFGEGVLDVKLLADKFELWITIEPTINYRVNDISELTDRIIPLNLLFFIKELREASGKMYVGGYARMSSIMKADGGSIAFDRVYSNQYKAGYARILGINKVGDHLGSLSKYNDNK